VPPAAARKVARWGWALRRFGSAARRVGIRHVDIARGRGCRGPDRGRLWQGERGKLQSRCSLLVQLGAERVSAGGELRHGDSQRGQVRRKLSQDRGDHVGDECLLVHSGGR